MRYEDIPPMPRERAAEMIAGGASDDKIGALLSVTLNGEDRVWVQRQCLDLLESDEASVRRIAVICLGHLARIHRELDVRTVLPRLRRLSGDPAVAGEVDDAIE